MFKDKKDVKELEISFKLEGYDDIFSDFDLRTYQKKALSDDFLSELKRASIDKSKVNELKLFVPSSKRNNQESVIKKRLTEHFNKHFALENIEYKNIIGKGFLFISVGVILMFVATFVLFYYGEKTLFLNFLIILLEPGGWFLFWEGLNLVIFEPKKIKPNLEFYRKMSKCRINFVSC